jgi:hypothetical protein
MSYEGVKYKTVNLDDTIPDDQRIDELRKWCRVFHEKGLAPYYPGGTHGNMSFRLKPGSSEIIITAARSSFAEYLDDDSFFIVKDVDPVEMKVFVQGNPKREPSSETLLHFAIYQSRTDVQAILHGHCPSISRQSTKMGIPTTHEFVEAGTNRIVESVMEILGSHTFIEIKDHGFMAMAISIEEAGQLSIEMLSKSLAIS